MAVLQSLELINPSLDDTQQAPHARDINYWMRPTFVVPLKALAAGADDTYGAFVAPCKLQIRAAYVVDVDGDRAADGSNYRTFAVVNKGSAAGETTTMASVNTSVTGLTQYVPREMTVATAQADQIVERGEAVIVTSTHAASGVAQGEGMVVIICKPVMER